MSRVKQNNGMNNNYTKRHYSSAPKNNYRQRGGYVNPSLFVKKVQEVIDAPKASTEARFDHYLIADIIKQNIATHGYTIPTPIQEQSIPEILLGRDVIGMAKTGTGKTAAFLITLINKVYHDPDQKVLIVVPTRELAVQISDEFRIFARGTGLYMTSIIGGTSINNQIQNLRRGPNFVVGTPGRLKDLVDRGDLNLDVCQNVVLDEVDRMVDIGFIHDIKYLISFLPKVRQSLFFSATVDGKTQEILTSFVQNPVAITIKSTESAENIDQDVIRLLPGQSKIDVLHDLLIQPSFQKVIIFGRTKWRMEKLSMALAERGLRSAIIHGNKSQNYRQRALRAFKNNQQNILIATDVASRGLDIDNVTHVINFDAPESYEDYIHRIGRTGRAGKRGVALTFVD